MSREHTTPMETPIDVGHKSGGESHGGSEVKPPRDPRTIDRDNLRLEPK